MFSAENGSFLTSFRGGPILSLSFLSLKIFNVWFWSKPERHDAEDHGQSPEAGQDPGRHQASSHAHDVQDERPGVREDLDAGGDEVNVANEYLAQVGDALVGVDHEAQVDHGKNDQHQGQYGPGKGKRGNIIKHSSLMGGRGS